MITKRGRYIVRENSKLMDALNQELREIARDLKACKAKPEEVRYDEYTEHERMMNSVRRNREEHARLQQEITDLCLLESYLKMDGDA